MPPAVAHADVLPVLEREFTTPILDLESLPGGNIARIFGFVTDDVAYVIRFNEHLAHGFANEARIIEMLAETSVPIPAMVRVGKLGKLDYAISLHAPGQTLQSLDHAGNEAVIPEMIAILDEIHRADISATTGYGDFDALGKGRSPSWRRHLLDIREDGPREGFYPPWGDLFATTLLERPMIDRLFARLTRLVGFCPEQRWLIHGDYGFDNILAENGRITAVIDWLGARFGDFIYDVAWLDLWSELDFTDRFARHYAESRQIIPELRERVLCYQCYMAIDALRFFALSGEDDAYLWLRDRALKLA